MKKAILIGFLTGLFIGLFLAGMFWSSKYSLVYEGYYKRGELIKLMLKR